MTPATANRASSDLRSTRCEQRRALRTATPRDFVRTLIDPPPELASFTLRHLFGGRGSASWTAANRPIPRFGPGRLEAALRSLRCRGYEWAVTETRLRELNEPQRRLLAQVVVDYAPESWRKR